jgi:hypothetical protein
MAFGARGFSRMMRLARPNAMLSASAISLRPDAMPQRGLLQPDRPAAASGSTGARR